MMLLFTLLACGSDETTDSAPASTVDCATAPADVTWDAFGHGFFLTYCTACHSANNADNRYGAPAEVNFDTEQDVYDLSDRVRVRVMQDADMPIGGGVYEDDLSLLDIYLTCQLGK